MFIIKSHIKLNFHLNFKLYLSVSPFCDITQRIQICIQSIKLAEVWNRSYLHFEYRMYTLFFQIET